MVIAPGCKPDVSSSQTIESHPNPTVPAASETLLSVSEKIKNIADSTVISDRETLSTKEREEVAKPEEEIPKKVPVKKRPKLKPKIKFDLIRYDFGTIMQGDTVDYKFKFTNTGKAPLVIENADVTCGCTQPSYPFIPIEAGEEGYIGVRYISVGKLGNQKPLITIKTNASKQPVTLMMAGIVDAPAKIDTTKKDLPEKLDPSIKDSISTIQDSLGNK